MYSIEKQLAENKKKIQQPEIGGHALDDIQRFAGDTRHMIVFDVLDHACPVGDKGERLRIFLSEDGYQNALISQNRGEMSILRHARVTNGSLRYDTPGVAYD